MSSPYRTARVAAIFAATSAILVTSGVYAAPASAAVTAGTCTVRVTSVGKGDSDQARMSADINCNKAKQVRLETYLYLCTSTGCSLRGNPNAHQTRRWSTLTGVRTGYATNLRDYCSVIASADVYYELGGITRSRGDSVSRTIC